MKSFKTIALIPVLSLLPTLFLTAQMERFTPITWLGGAVNCNENDYELIFFDDFDGDHLNTDYWITYYPGCENGDQCHYSRTHNPVEEQIYFDENVVVKDGILYLESYYNPTQWFEEVRDYTSGMIHSRVTYTYGKFEARIKIPSVDGYWPAYWLWGGGVAPNMSEVDIFEFGTDELRDLHTNIHACSPCDCITCGIGCRDCGGPSSFAQEYRGSKPFSNDFHVYTCEWGSNFVKWFVDGKLIRKINRFVSVSDKEINCNDAPGVGTIFHDT